MSGSFLDWHHEQDDRPRQPSRGRRKAPYTLDRKSPFDWDEFASPENLMKAYRIARWGGQAPGISGLRFPDLSSTEAYDMLRTLSDALHTGRYRPCLHRDAEIPKPNGKKRKLSIPEIWDRTLSTAIDRCLRPYFASIFPDLHTSPWDIFAAVEAEYLQTGHTYLIEADITECYPSIQIDDVLETLHDYITNPFLLRCIEQVAPQHPAGDRFTRPRS